MKSFMDLFDSDIVKKSRPYVITDARPDLLRKQNIKSAGFTLVEVLAVVAMIGFLASIIIVRLSESKKQGEDSAVIGGLREIRNAAELYNEQNTSYEGVCNPADTSISDDGDFGRIKAYIEQYNGEFGSIGCKDSDNGYSAISSLKTGDCWCVDYQGASRKILLGGAGECSDLLVGITCP